MFAYNLPVGFKLSREGEQRFVAKVCSVRTRKDKDYFVFRMNVPKEISETLELVNGDYLVLNARKAKWYDLVEWQEMPKTWELMPESLRNEIHASRTAQPRFIQLTSPTRVTVDVRVSIDQDNVSPSLVFATAVTPVQQQRQREELVLPPMSGTQG